MGIYTRLLGVSWAQSQCVEAQWQLLWSLCLPHFRPGSFPRPHTTRCSLPSTSPPALHSSDSKSPQSHFLSEGTVRPGEPGPTLLAGPQGRHQPVLAPNSKKLCT